MSHALTRAIEAVAIVWLAVTLGFILMQAIPGDAPLEAMSAAGASPQAIAERRAQLGLEAPITEQYLRYLAGAVTGRLGVSLLDGRPVSEIVSQQALSTLELTAAAGVFTLIVGTALGYASAGDGKWAHFPRVLLGLCLSVPVLWLGTLVLSWDGMSGGVFGADSVLAPAMVLGISGAGALGIVTERALRETLSQPFVLAARARGLRERHILARHVLRASAAPILSAFILQIGFLLSGAVLTEALFNRQGIGRLLAQSALRQDYPVVLGVIIWAAIGYALLLLIADLATYRLDPRLDSGNA